MRDNDKKFLEQWKKQREQGFYRFSVITGSTYAIFVFVFKKVFDWDFYFSQKDIYTLAIAFLIGILLLGPFLWWNRERKYKKIKETQSKKKPKKR